MSDKKRRVEVYERNEAGDRVLIGEGTFQQYGIGYRVLEYVTRQMTSAIIEMDDGFIKNVPVENIRYISGGTA